MSLLNKVSRYLPMLYLYKNKYARNLAVIGAGLMGSGIAHVSIDKGYNVILRDTTTKALSRGYSQITKGYQSYLKRKRLTK